MGSRTELICCISDCGAARPGRLPVCPSAVDSGRDKSDLWIIEDVEDFVTALHLMVDAWAEVRSHLAQVRQ